MSEAAQITRRGFLGAAVGIGATALLARSKPWQALVSISGPSLAERLVGLIRDRPSAQAVGTAYLDIVPEDASVKRLVDGVVSGLPAGREGIQGVQDEELRTLLAARIGSDFEQVPPGRGRRMDLVSHGGSFVRPDDPSLSQVR